MTTGAVRGENRGDLFFEVDPVRLRLRPAGLGCDGERAHGANKDGSRPENKDRASHVKCHIMARCAGIRSHQP